MSNILINILNNMMININIYFRKIGIEGYYYVYKKCSNINTVVEFVLSIYINII